MNIFKKFLFCFIILFSIFIVLEFTVRCLRPDIVLLGINNNFFIKDKFGPDTFGFKANLNGNIFGKNFQTNDLGFRVFSSHSKLVSQDNQCTILMLGDSLAFGPGVDVEKTFPFLVGQKINHCNVINTSVIGYGINDYYRLLTYMLKRFQFDIIVINMCLNDFSPESQNLIRNFLQFSTPVKTITVWQMPRVFFERNRDDLDFNAFLRKHSRLYLLMRNYLLDVSRIFFEAEAKYYALPDTQKIIPLKLKQLRDLAEKNNKKIIFFLFPFEYQLRSNRSANILFPQDVIKKAARENHLLLFDLYPSFKEALSREYMDSKSLYLTGDPMHFSEKGHKIISDQITSILVKNNLI